MPAARGGAPTVGDWWRVAAVAVGIALAFVVVRLEVTAKGDVSRFVVAGTTFADPSQVPPGLYVFDSGGFDGQFYWRIAADPAHLQTDTHLGLRMDQPLRLQRIGYPYLAWLVSLGHLSLVPWALVIVNVAAIGALAAMGAIICREASRSAWWGLVLAAVPAFVFTLSRDLTELVASVALVGGILAARRQRWWLAAVLWSYGVLTREQLLAAVAAFGAWRLLSIVRRRSRFGQAEVAWIAPFLAFGAWQLVVRRTDGRLPQFSGTASNIGPPVVGLAGALGHWASELGHGIKDALTNALTIYELAVLVVIVVFALRTEVPRDRSWERWMIVALAALGLTLTRDPLETGSDLRVYADLWVLAWVVLLSSACERILTGLAVIQTVGMLGAAAVRLAAI